MPNRSYTSPLRTAEAAKTRSAILDAAATLFARDGYIATTMKGIAAEAGVSVQSVHLAGSKVELLIGAFERSFAGNEGRESLAERPEIAEIMGDPDALRALSRWVDFVVDANRRSAALSRAMVTAAEADPVATAAVSDLDARRRADMALAAAWAAGRDLISSDVQPGVADELGFLTGPETYAYLVDRTGWSHERYRIWLGARVDEVLQRGRNTD